MMFLRLIAGRRVCWSACCVAGAKAFVVTPTWRMDVFRAELLRRTLAGKTVRHAQEAAESMLLRFCWNFTDRRQTPPPPGRPTEGHAWGCGKLPRNGAMIELADHLTVVPA